MTYTKEMCLADIAVLMPIACVALKQWGALTECAKCSAPGEGVIIGNEGIVLALCQSCGRTHASSDSPSKLDMNGWDFQAKSYFVTPGSEKDCRTLTEMLRKATFANLLKLDLLPIVMRPLQLDRKTMSGLEGDSMGIVAMRSGKRVRAFRCPIPFYPDDPPIMGGKVARDAVSLVKSIQAGKTKGYSFLSGPVMLTSNDDNLIKAWSKP